MKKRADPKKRGRLVASKKAWRDTVSLLIAKLIAFKRGLNGHGDDDAGLPSVDLKDPFPVEFHTYLSSIVDDYHKVINGADFIMNLQDDFSKTRRKGKKELRELAAAIEQEEQLRAEASWWGSRAWAWFALYGLGKDIRKARLKMLSIARQSIHSLHKLEYRFTSGEDVKGIVSLTRFINLFVGSYGTWLENLKYIETINLPKLPEGAPEGAPEEGQTEPGDTIISGKPPKKEIGIKEVEADLYAGLNADLKAMPESDWPSEDKVVIDDLHKKLLKAIKGKAQESEIVDAYKMLKTKINEAKGKSKSASAEDELTAFAQNALKRWVGRKLLEFNPDKVDHIRMQVVDEIRKAVANLKNIMDILERTDRSTADIISATSELASTLQRMIDHTIVLADDYRLRWRLEEDKKERPERLAEGITGKLKKLRDKVIPRFLS